MCFSQQYRQTYYIYRTDVLIFVGLSARNDEFVLKY